MGAELSCGKPEAIALPRLLLVEGRDEVNLFYALMRHLNIEGIQVKDLKSKYSLSVNIGAVKRASGFNQVASLGVVLDADTSAKASFNKVIQALRDNQLPYPARPMVPTPGKPSVTVLIVPHGADTGMLENVCLESVQSDPAMDCLDSYFDCLQRRLDQMPANMAKARVHAFLASRPRPDLRTGEAAAEGYWLWDSPAFDALKKLLTTI